MVKFAQKPSASGGLCPGFPDPDPLLQGTWSMTFTRGFVVDPTAGEPSDPIGYTPRAKKNKSRRSVRVKVISRGGGPGQGRRSSVDANETEQLTNHVVRDSNDVIGWPLATSEAYVDVIGRGLVDV